MASPTKLTQPEVEQALHQLPKWRLTDGTLERKFLFPSFKQAFAFMTEVAFEAEAINHHPDWSNGYNEINIRLITHSVKHLSNLDVMLAERIDTIFQRYE